MSKRLFDGSSDSDAEITQLKTNQEYAKSYNRFRGKELLKKLKDRDKNNESISSSSDDDSGSSEEEVVDKKFDEAFFKTLSLLKSKNPDIYDNATTFFQSANPNEGSGQKQRKKKAMTIRDYERKVILESGGKYQDDDDESADDVEDENRRPVSPSYVAEQKKLRQEFKKVLDSDDGEEEEFGGIFRKREKTKNEVLEEDEQYVAWLAGQKDEIAEGTAKALNPLKKYWADPNLSKQEQFLRDYILCNGYQNNCVDEIPTYDEVVADSEDEKELDKQAEFEYKFNFRFEEPDKDFIKRYPRTVNISVRKKDERRKEKRTEIKERKLKEKEHKLKELELLKQIKRKEIEEKIQKLKEVTGNEELGFKEEELDEDFDPTAHDKRMQELFNDEYYGVDEGEEKPECPDIDELKTEDWDSYDPKKDDGGIDDDYEPHCEDDDFNMDCDYDPQMAKEATQNELIESTKSRRKRRRRNQFMEMIKKEKPAFNPEDEKTYGDYIDEYYKMDCEDIIGDVPCRFKYVETIPNDFGLTTEEILLAKTKELNQWVSLKKTIQIRPNTAEWRDKKLFKMKAKNDALKRKIFTSIYGLPSEDEGDEPKKAEPSTSEKSNGAGCSNAEMQGSKKKKKKNKKLKLDTDSDSITDSKAKGAAESAHNVGESEPMDHSKASANDSEVSVGEATITETTENSKVEKKKKKKKKKQNDSITNPFNSKNEPKKQKKQTARANDIKNKSINKKDNNKTGNTRTNFKTGPQNNGTDICQLSDDRLRAYGLNPRKFRNQLELERQQSRPQQFSTKNDKFKHKMKK